MILISLRRCHDHCYGCDLGPDLDHVHVHGRVHHLDYESHRRHGWRLLHHRDCFRLGHDHHGFVRPDHRGRANGLLLGPLRRRRRCVGRYRAGQFRLQKCLRRNCRRCRRWNYLLRLPVVDRNRPIWRRPDLLDFGLGYSALVHDLCRVFGLEKADLHRRHLNQMTMLNTKDLLNRLLRAAAERIVRDRPCHVCDLRTGVRVPRQLPR